MAAINECMARLILGIDPGIDGAAALLRVPAALDQAAVRAGVADTLMMLAAAGRDRPVTPLVGPPRLERLVPAAASIAIGEMARRADLVVVEAQRASPRMGVASAFSLGTSWGRVKGVLEAVHEDGVVEVQPNVWRGAYGLSGGEDGKKAGLALADALLGGDSILRRHDEADAVLLAWWGYRRMLAGAF